MAQVPTDKHIQQAQLETQQEINEKRIDQQLQGKDFVISDDGHGPGVIPEDVWQSHKEQPNE